MARIITIARKMGSGGKTIGKMLSQELGYKYYDKELIKLASDESGINERFFELVDEKIKNPGFFRRKGVYKGALLDPDHPDFTSDGNLFNYQAEIIRQLADKEPAIIVGRCADYILKDREDAFHVFVHADESFRAERIVTKYGESEKSPESRLNEKDKRRRVNYQHYTGRTWGMAQNYDLCVDSGTLGEEQCADIIVNIVKNSQK